MSQGMSNDSKGTQDKKSATINDVSPAGAYEDPNSTRFEQDQIASEAPLATGQIITDPTTGKERYTGSRITDTNRYLHGQGEARRRGIVAEIENYRNPAAELGVDPELFRAQWAGSLEMADIDGNYANSAFAAGEYDAVDGYTNQGSPWGHIQREMNTGSTSEAYLSRNLTAQDRLSVASEHDAIAAQALRILKRDGSLDSLPQEQRELYEEALEKHLGRDQSVFIFEKLRRGEELSVSQEAALNIALRDSIIQFKAEHKIHQLKVSQIVSDLDFILDEGTPLKVLRQYAEDAGIDTRKINTLTGIVDMEGRFRDKDEVQALLLSQRLNGLSFLECQEVERHYDQTHPNSETLQKNIDTLHEMMDTDILMGFEARVPELQKSLEQAYDDLHSGRVAANATGGVFGGAVAVSSFFAHRPGLKGATAQIPKSGKLGLFVAGTTAAAMQQAIRNANEEEVRKLEQDLSGLSREQLALLLDGTGLETTLRDRIKTEFATDRLTEMALATPREDVLQLGDAEIVSRAGDISLAMNFSDGVYQDISELPVSRQDQVKLGVASALHRNLHALSAKQREAVIQKLEELQKSRYADPETGKPIVADYPLTFPEMLQYATGLEKDSAEKAASDYQIGYSAEQTATNMLTSLRAYQGFLGREQATASEQEYVNKTIQHYTAGLSKEQVTELMALYDGKLDQELGGLRSRLEDVIGVEHSKLIKLYHGSDYYPWEKEETAYNLKRDGLGRSMEEIYNLHGQNIDRRFRLNDAVVAIDRIFNLRAGRAGIIGNLTQVPSGHLTGVLKLYAANNGDGGMQDLKGVLGARDYQRLLAAHKFKLNFWYEAAQVMAVYDETTPVSKKLEAAAQKVASIEGELTTDAQKQRALTFRKVAILLYPEKMTDIIQKRVDGL